MLIVRDADLISRNELPEAISNWVIGVGGLDRSAELGQGLAGQDKRRRDQQHARDSDIECFHHDIAPHTHCPRSMRTVVYSV